MRRTLLTQGLVLSLSPLGCSTAPGIPEARGKAIVTVDGEELVLDTGDGGKQLVSKFDDAWYVDCSLINGEINLELADRSRDRKGFYYLDLHLLSSEREGGDAATVDLRLYVGDALFHASCPATLRTSEQTPYECEFSFAECDLSQLASDQDVVSARVERASFYARSCFLQGED
ncbi:hypothetical protein SOCE26_087170 [Sorangium cellulosum]|uniref:Uncharacterized protein n=1 Tax=Sorangium cellulosum TaxID=56 RepID=A0A2L0F6K3_SORCE|nr:hypothetical protein [Sorangium cellulosum]AUX47205.1 hypothetical protein SOCE26_087170 [Sorangium cellulosum]